MSMAETLEEALRLRDEKKVGRQLAETRALMQLATDGVTLCNRFWVSATTAGWLAAWLAIFVSHGNCFVLPQSTGYATLSCLTRLCSEQPARTSEAL